ncbi:DNA topoisomerase [Oscillospiraceae bacterium HV4-5-C5C]|nr:DNA topoisomerase [Oscillospiraceae bacterium HV4-5-C5C]
MTGKKTYDNDSISSLKGADRVRLRPAVIFGSDGLEGCEHAFFEILSNSIDEAREGYGSVIKVRRYADQSLEIEDNGRGIPVDYNASEKRYNWELVYCELYAGGKYNNNSGENYVFSLGLNGLGACATQYASAWFEAIIHRDGYEYKLNFKKGVNEGGLSKEPWRGRQSGTLQRWLPDRDVFTDIRIPLEFFTETLKRQAVVNAGISFVFDDELTDTHETFCYPDGILGYIREIGGDHLLCEPVYFEAEGHGRDRSDKPEYKVKAQIAFSFDNEVNRTEYYHNSSFLEHGGSPDKAVRLAFVSTFDRLARDRGKYKANESKITYADIEDCLLLVISSFSTQTSYENQTKKAINNRYIQEFLTEQLKAKLEIWAIENLQDSDRAAEQILVNKRSRESAEKQRLNVKKTLMGKVDLANRVKKFVPCRSKDPARTELYIVEGDSALGSTKMGRDAEFQAIIPIRGKILNCLKADYQAIFKNDIITDLVKVLGCGVEIKTKHNKDLSAFDLSQLRWNKVIICTDADVDGYQIRTLVLAMFYRLMPTLLSEGKVYIAESPLFEITARQGREEQTYFAYTEAERSKVLNSLKGKTLSIQRSKGLGENEPEMMWVTTMNPETRRLIQVQPDDAVKMSETFDLLLGDNLAGRKKHIEISGHLYLDQLDVD